jgi:antitoxin VapB
MLVDRRTMIWYIPDMTTTLFTNGRSQAVRIPKELRFEGKEVSIRRIGDGVLLIPVKASSWPAGFFEGIRIDDANFTRPEQGELPPVVELTR